MHDYEITWDYELDEAVDASVKEHIATFVEDLKKDLLPGLNVFEDFEVHCILLPNEQLGTFVTETCEKPVIGIAIANHKEACNEYSMDFNDAIETSILHELGHAIQEYVGKDFNEEEAEEFAYQYNFRGHIYKEILQ